jgi:hypothetical protein
MRTAAAMDGIAAIVAENERLRHKLAELAHKCDIAEQHGSKTIDLHTVRTVIG